MKDKHCVFKSSSGFSPLEADQKYVACLQKTRAINDIMTSDLKNISMNSKMFFAFEQRADETMEEYFLKNFYQQKIEEDTDCLMTQYKNNSMSFHNLNEDVVKKQVINILEIAKKSHENFKSSFIRSKFFKNTFKEAIRLCNHKFSKSEFHNTILTLINKFLCEITENKYDGFYESIIEVHLKRVKDSLSKFEKLLDLFEKKHQKNELSTFDCRSKYSEVVNGVHYDLRIDFIYYLDTYLPLLYNSIMEKLRSYFIGYECYRPEKQSETEEFSDEKITINTILLSEYGIIKCPSSSFVSVDSTLRNLKGTPVRAQLPHTLNSNHLLTNNETISKIYNQKTLSLEPVIRGDSKPLYNDVIFEELGNKDSEFWRNYTSILEDSFNSVDRSLMSIFFESISDCIALDSHSYLHLAKIDESSFLNILNIIKKQKCKNLGFKSPISLAESKFIHQIFMYITRNPDKMTKINEKHPELVDFAISTVRGLILLDDSYQDISEKFICPETEHIVSNLAKIREIWLGLWNKKEEAYQATKNIIKLFE